MQVCSRARHVTPRVFKYHSHPSFLYSATTTATNAAASESSLPSASCRSFQSFTSCSGIVGKSNWRSTLHFPSCSVMMQRTPFSSIAATEVVKELYDKMLNSVSEKRTAPPNAWLWSLIDKCANREDIKLLFNVLERLRVFRLSNLRIQNNFNSALCREVTKVCVRAGAIDYGKKTLWKHNVYGLTPDIGCAHHLLLYAKQHNDSKLMVEIMKLLKKNDLPLQPGTADIVFSICCQSDNWDLLSKYAKRFVKAGVKLRPSSIDMWLDSAAKRGDVDSLWKIWKIRVESMKEHSIASVFACAKGHLLEGKPEEAAAIIQTLNQDLSDAKRPGIISELVKLVSEWPLEVIKHQKEEKRKALAIALQNDIPAMLNVLSSRGIQVDVNMEDLTKKEGVLC